MPEARTLAVSRCGRCGLREPGVVVRCRRCGAEVLEREAVSGDGRLVSWTVVRRPSGAFADRDTFAVALVDLEAGLRVTGNLAHWEREPVLGAPVSVVGFEHGVPVFSEGRA